MGQTDHCGVGMTLTEIAKRISVHLHRFEEDPAINNFGDALREQDKLKPYWLSRAFQAGRYVGVIYVDYQGASNLTKAQAEKYLAWLDAGNVGKHWKAIG